MALSSTEEAQTRALIAQQAAILSLASSEPTIISKLAATKVSLADLTAATSLSDTDLFLVRQGTTEKSVAKSIVSPTTANASETVKGVVELATSSETLTGTDNTRAVTPAGLQSKVSSETAIGLIELATSAEAVAGTDALRAITPAGLRSGLNASGTAPIYACRAWVNFNGTGTVAIRSSGNVSSITDNGIGNYTVNFTTALSDSSYGWHGFCRKPDTLTTPSTVIALSTSIKTVSSLQIHTTSGVDSLFDSSEINVSIFR